MSNSTVSSQESAVVILETETGEVLKSESADMNFHQLKGDSIEYTYHKHSAPKHVIYYRCSDKRCPARVRFNPTTKEFILKNQHLDEKRHKKPCSQKAISSDDLIASSNLIMRGPLVINEAHIPQELRSNEDFAIPLKRQNSEESIANGQNQMFLLQVKVDDDKNLEKFSKVLVEKCLASKVLSYLQGKRFTKEICEERSQKVIEIYTLSHFMGKVLLHINNYFGRGAEILFFKQE